MWKLLLSSVPVIIVALLFKEKIDMLFEGNMLVVGLALIATSILLSFTYFCRNGHRTEYKHDGHPSIAEHDITWLDAFIIGCAQAIAVIPGLSRSGSTIGTGLLLGDRRDKVAQFSFFMVIIPILGQALLTVKDILTASSADIAASGDAAITASVGIVPLIVGFIAAFVVGCIACKWMIELVKKGKLVWFAIYCAAAGCSCIIWNLCH